MSKHPRHNAEHNNNKDLEQRKAASAIVRSTVAGQIGYIRHEGLRVPARATDVVATGNRSMLGLIREYGLQFDMPVKPNGTGFTRPGSITARFKGLGDRYDVTYVLPTELGTVFSVTVDQDGTIKDFDSTFESTFGRRHLDPQQRARFCTPESGYALWALKTFATCAGIEVSPAASEQ